jgi:type IV pilus assembly protein PilM
MNLKKEIRLPGLGRKSEKTSGGKKQSAAKAGKKRSRFGSKSSSGELVGVKLGATQISAARVSNGAGRPKLLQVERQELPSGIVISGEVHDVPALAAGLDEFFRTHKLPRRGVRIGLATNHVGVRIFELSGIDDDAQLANAVLFRAHEVVSIPIDEAVIDYRVIDEETIGGVTNRRILLVAAYREPIERYMAAFREAGIELVGVDLEAFALLRAVTAPAPEGHPAGAAVVSLNVGHERTILAVSDGAVCQFTRVLEWGGAKLAGAIERDMHVRAQEAQELLRQLSFDPDQPAAPAVQAAPAEAPVAEPVASDPAVEAEGDALVGDAPASLPSQRSMVASTLAPRPIQDGDAEGQLRLLAAAREAAVRELHVLARELVSSLQFYQGQPGALPFVEVLVSGGTSRVSGFVAELERLTRVKVRAADPLTRVEVATGVGDRDDLASLAIAIGLGVED